MKPQPPRPKVMGVEVPPRHERLELPPPLHGRAPQKTLREMPPPPAPGAYKPPGRIPDDEVPPPLEELDATWEEPERPTRPEGRRRQRSRPDVVVTHIDPVNSEPGEPSIRDLERKVARAKLEFVLKLLAALGIGGGSLLGGGKFLLDLVRGPEAPPAPPADIRCPPFEQDKAPRGALCSRIHDLEGWVGELQSVEHARRKEAEREKKMLGQKPPTLKP